ncbi:MAG: efflux RND transporter periplasmic adaptor subunit [bacterium]|nr:efflux RND transporter periplasmic adaptor subunit [Candidatus Kapabacteria bacterium]
MNNTQTPGSPAAIENARDKRKRRTLLIVLAVLFVAGLIAAALLWRPWEAPVDTHAADAGNTYTCPMHPQIRNEGPGICPICFMDLVPMKAKATADSDPKLSKEAVALTERGRIVADVATTTVTSRAINSVIDASAGVDYNEATHRVVTARYPGRIERLFVDETGQFVQKGSPIMEVYSPELVSAQQEFLVARETPAIDLPTLDASSAAQDRRPAGERLVNAARRRLELLGMTPAQIGALASRGTIAYTSTVFAPASGTVLKRGVTEGAYVNVGTLIVEMVDLSSVYVIANVVESDAWRVRAGHEMSVSGPAIGGETMHGRIDYIYPSVDASTRSVRVRGVFPNGGMRLKPGMYLNARILAPQGEALVVPVSAVIRTGRRDLVYIEVATNTFEPREVKLGARQGDYYEIAGGSVNKGDRIVIEGGYLIDSESRLSSTGTEVSQ